MLSASIRRLLCSCRTITARYNQLPIGSGDETFQHLYCQLPALNFRLAAASIRQNSHADVGKRGAREELRRIG